MCECACVCVCVCACVPSGLCPGSGSGGKRGQLLYENVWCLAPPGGAGLRLHAPNTEGWALSLLREQDPTRQRTTKSSHVELLSQAVKRREVKSKAEKVSHLNAEFQRTARRDKPSSANNAKK